MYVINVRLIKKKKIDFFSVSENGLYSPIFPIVLMQCVWKNVQSSSTSFFFFFFFGICASNNLSYYSLCIVKKKKKKITRVTLINNVAPLLWWCLAMHGLIGVCVYCMLAFKYSWGLDLIIKII